MPPSSRSALRALPARGRRSDTHGIGADHPSQRRGGAARRGDARCFARGESSRHHARHRGRAQRRGRSARGLAADPVAAGRQRRDRARAARRLKNWRLKNRGLNTEPDMSDPLVIAGRAFTSRLFLGTAGYPNRQVMLDAVAASGTEMVTASIRRISLAGEDESLVDLIPKQIHFLPNTAGCQTAKDAVLTAELAREALETNWIKLEVIGDRELLYPDTEELIRATELLVGKGFVVL